MESTLSRYIHILRKTTFETGRRVSFQRWCTEITETVLSKMEPNERLLASIIQPALESLALSTDLPQEETFVPVLMLSGPHGSLAPIVRQLLEAFREATWDSHIQVTVAEGQNSDNEPCLGLVRHVAEWPTLTGAVPRASTAHTAD